MVMDGQLKNMNNFKGDVEIMRDKVRLKKQLQAANKATLPSLLSEAPLGNNNNNNSSIIIIDNPAVLRAANEATLQSSPLSLDNNNHINHNRNNNHNNNAIIPLHPAVLNTEFNNINDNIDHLIH